MADKRTSDRREAPSSAELRAASRRLRYDTSAALQHLFDAAVAALTPPRPAPARVVVRRDRRAR